MIRPLAALFALIIWSGLAVAQQTNATDAPEPSAAERSQTGGATTLEDILARQRGEKVDTEYRASNTGQGNVEALIGQLGTRGVASDSDIYRALRYGSADISVSSRGPGAEVIIQDGGMWWLQVREGPLATYGAYLLGGMLALLVLFYLLRGKIRIDGEKTGRTITRFSGFERFGHWLFGGSFLILGATGLVVLFGRAFVIPWMGKEAFANIAFVSKMLHNNIAWAFMLGLVIITVNWVVHNIPNRHDLKWLAVGGGLFSKDVHPPARKFNAGQKIIFWSCVVFGLIISATGLSLLFPFQIALFEPFVGIINGLGIPGWFGQPPLSDPLTPHQEMQFAQVLHLAIAFLFLAIIFAHIYLGSVGMEGAFDAMGSGEVELQWAREHHRLWVEEVEEAEKDRAAAATSPAE